LAGILRESEKAMVKRTFLFFKHSFLNVFYWACALILWTYMSVSLIGYYRSWYFATAVVVVLAGWFLAGGILEARGLLKAVGMISLYYFYLLLTALWAEYPETTLWWVTIELIFIVIFALFYLISLNYSVSRVTDFFVYLIPPAAVIFIVSSLIDPGAKRLGWYALNILPFLLLFCVLRLIESFSGRNIVLLAACLLMLLLGMSRTPLLMAGIGIVLMGTLIAGWKARFKLAVVFAAVGLVLTITVMTYQPLSVYAAKTFSRIAYQDVTVGDEFIEAEAPDIVRWTIFDDALSLLETNWLWGMGYMNFMPWYGDRYGFVDYTVRDEEVVGMSLHNSFQTWALEGGVPCLAIVILLLWRYFRILRRQIRHSKNDMERSYYKTYIVAMICLIVLGFFHQPHQMPIFFILLGIVYALDEKNRCEPPRPSRLKRAVNEFLSVLEPRWQGGHIEMTGQVVIRER